MESAITAIGIANPTYSRSQDETADLIVASLALGTAERRMLKSVYKATGIQKRHSVIQDYSKNAGEFEFFPNGVDEDFPSTAARMQIYRDHALPLALQAIQDCLKSQENSDRNFDKGTITHVITVSCTGMYAPGLDIEIVQTLQLGSTTKRTAINFMGCYGAFNGLKVADDICRANPLAVVLLVSVELCTIHFQKSMHLDNVLSNALFADGASAALIQARSATRKQFVLKQFHCDLIPQTEKEMAWEIGNSGFDIVLSSYVPEAIQSGIAQFFEKFKQTQTGALSKIDKYAIHPGGLKILQACEKALNLSEKDNKYSYEVLRDYGNMSSATILFVLKKMWEDAQVKKEETIFACAFGPGLTLESVLLAVT